MSNNLYQLREYGVIRKASDFADSITSSIDELYLPDSSFDSLFNFILENQSTGVEKDPPFSLFIKSKRKQIKVKNYVGVVETSDGVKIEILPKIHLTNSKDEVKDTKGIFLKMLRHLKDSPFINISEAHLNLKQNFPILEVFIKSFIDEAERVFTSGIKSGYLLEEENLKFLRGKLLVGKNIKHNASNKTKFYCQYSEFSQDIPHNRIIKTALVKLTRITSDYTNLAALNKVLTNLENVNISSNLALELAACNSENRFFKKYQKLIDWSKIFLLNKAFTNFSGTSLNVAILFPMERIFEDYIASLFSKFADGFRVKAQDKSYFLVEKHLEAGKFRLRPDLLLDSHDEVERIVIDTKWKLIDETSPSKNYNITSADMYQLFAYGKKYSVNDKLSKLAMIYPLNSNFEDKLPPFYYYENGLKLEVFPFDFEADAEGQVKSIIASL